MLGQLMWASPLWGWAVLAAGGLPVLAHVLSRLRRRVVVFPTVRFLEQAMTHGRRGLRLRDWLLLLLRVLALGLIVAAFAQPVWRGSTVAALHGAGRHVVFVLDRSASMTRAEHGVTLLDQARRLVLDELARLDPASDRASVILLDRSPRPLLPEPTAHFSQLAQMLGQVEATHQAGDGGAAAALAQHMVELDQRGEAALRRAATVELYSDMQATQAWPGDVRLTVYEHRLGNALGNVALHRPTLWPSEPVAGQAVRLSVEVSYFDSEATASVALPVTLTFGDQVQTQLVRVGANLTATAAFTFTPTPEQPGPATLVVRIDPRDALALDDEVGLAFEVAPGRRVMLATASAINDQATAAYFMARALRPEKAGDDVTETGVGKLSGVSLEVVAPWALAAHLHRAPPSVVVVIEAGLLDDAALVVLRQFAAQGGGVLWVIDSPAAVESAARFDAAVANQGAAPLRFVLPVSVGSDLELVEGRFDDPILRAFEGPSRATLMSARLGRVYHATAAPEAGAVVLLSAKDEAGQWPVLAVRWVELGRMAILPVDLAPGQATLVTGPAFVPLVHQLVRHLSPGRPTPANPHPDATRPHVGFAGPVYVELDPAESDLRIDDVEAATAAGGQGVAGVAAADQEGMMRDDVTTPLWPWCVLAAAVVIGLEQAIVAGYERGSSPPGRRAGRGASGSA
ncbi:MAG: VWA domain-containing protein [Phycisphaeraceae bacterium]